MSTFAIDPATFDPQGQLGTIYTAGENLVAGEAVYRHAADGTVRKAKSDDADRSACIGLVAQNAYAGQKCSVVSSGECVVGDYTFGGFVTEPLVVASASSPGDLQNWGGADTTEWIGFVGRMVAHNKLVLDVMATKQQKVVIPSP